jgi:hypothetical protein
MAYHPFNSRTTHALRGKYALGSFYFGLLSTLVAIGIDSDFMAYPFNLCWIADAYLGYRSGERCKKSRF